MDISILPPVIFYHSYKPGTPVKCNERDDKVEKKQIVMRRRGEDLLIKKGRIPCSRN
jgi:hypothetical protein